MVEKAELWRVLTFGNTLFADELRKSTFFSSQRDRAASTPGLKHYNDVKIVVVQDKKDLTTGTGYQHSSNILGLVAQPKTAHWPTDKAIGQNAAGTAVHEFEHFLKQDAPLLYATPNSSGNFVPVSQTTFVDIKMNQEARAYLAELNYYKEVAAQGNAPECWYLLPDGKTWVNLFQEFGSLSTTVDGYIDLDDPNNITAVRFWLTPTEHSKYVRSYTDNYQYYCDTFLEEGLKYFREGQLDPSWGSNPGVRDYVLDHLLDTVLSEETSQRPAPYSLASFGDGFKKDLSVNGKVMYIQEPDGPGQTLMPNEHDWTPKLGPYGSLFDINPFIDMGYTLCASVLGPIAAGPMTYAEAVPAYDPLILDLDGDGFQLTSADFGRFIQQEGNEHFANGTSWLRASSNDGILFFDSFNDGVLYSPDQLFGNSFVKPGNVLAIDGFDALASLDSNNDLIIDAQDDLFEKIKIELADGSVISLDEADILSISLTPSSYSQTDGYGNELVSIASFTRSDSSTSVVGDFNLAVSTYASIALDFLEVDESVLELPDAFGLGKVYSLHQAIMRDPSGVLKGLVQQFTSSSSQSEREELLTDILFRWTGADAVAPDAFGIHIDGRHVHVINQFRGIDYDNFVGGFDIPVIGGVSAQFIDSAYVSMRNLLFAQLMVQTHLFPIAESIDFLQSESGITYMDLSDCATSLLEAIDNDESAGKELLADFVRAIKGFGGQYYSNFASFYETLLDAKPELQWILDSAGLSATIGSSERDVINASTLSGTPIAIDGGAGNDLIYSNGVTYGGAGDDVISAGFIDDLIVGGLGNDEIYSGPGRATYLFNLGDGYDTIYQNFPTSIFTTGAVSQSGDTVRFGNDISIDDLTFSVRNADLYVQVGNDQAILLKDQFNRTYLQKYVTGFEFIDGSFLDFESIVDAFLSVVADSSIYVAPSYNLNITVSNSDSDIRIASGNSNLIAGTGNYSITTGVGSNNLTLGQGSTTIVFDTNINYVHTGTGATTIESSDVGTFVDYFNNSGNSVLFRNSGDDSLFFADEIASDLAFTVVGSDLIVTSSETSRQITIKEQIADSSEYNSLVFNFKDGTNITWNTLRSSLEYTGTSAGNSIDRSAQSANEIINGLGGNDTIIAGSGNDTIVITKGDQTVNGGEGDNIYIYSPGNGEAIIDESSGVNAPGEADTLIFTKGIYQAGTYFTASGNDLIISFRGSSDQITILGELLSSPTRVIDTFKFSTGVELSLNDIITASFNPAAQDQFVYKASSENDSFDFALNDGLVKIIDGRYGNDEGENDTLVFGAGIGHNDLLLSSSGSSYDLAINIDGTNDTVTITNELLTGDLKRVGLFDFNVDSNLTLAQLLDMHAVQVSSSIDNDNIDRRLSFANENIVTTGENATIYAGTGDNTITDDDGDATIVAGTGTSIIDAGAGTNVIDLTNDGDATVILGEGDTTVYDGAGDTLYQVNLGSGNSVIYQQTTSDTPGNAVIEFGNDITLNDLTLQSHGLDLIINITGGQSILLKSGLSSDLFKNVSEFNFTEDSTSYTLHELVDELPPEVLVTNDNWLEDRHFSFADETISLIGSNDRLNVGQGDVTVNVTGDNNRVFAGSNDNQINIDEGALNTFINVGGGSTNIHIEKGTGHTVVAEFLTANVVGNNDHITLGTGIDDNDIVVTAKGQDITLAFNNTEEDQLTLQNALNPYQAKQISDITFADSTVMDLDDILALGVTFYEEDDFRTVGNKDWTFDKTVNASGDYQKIHLGEGTDILNVTGKNATVYGGAGEATVNFEDGMGSVVFFEEVEPGTSGNNDAVSFGGTLDLDDVRLTYNDAGDLILWFDGTNDIINFRDQFDSAQKEIEQFTFNDGAEVLSRSELFDRTFYFTMEGDNATMYHTYDFNEEIVVNGNNAHLNLLGEGESYDVTLNGDSAWVQLYGSESTVTINGADAEIYAGGPSTTFILNEGFGNLFIDEDISSALPNIDDDHIIFGEGFDVEDMILSYDQTGAALLISFAGSTDQIRIDQQMYSSPFKTVEDFTFADATVLTFADILAEGIFYFTYDADDDGDTHFGTLNENVTINGNNVHFNAADGTNTITINGDDGWVQVADGNSTVIVNGADAEIYTGMNGEQTFVVNAGTGNVFISETYGGSGALPNDHLVFGEGISFDDIYLTYVNSTDLVIGVIGTNDTVTIDEQVSGSAKKRVGDFTFGATTMSYNDLLANGRFYFYLNTDNDGLNHFGSTNEYIELNGYNDMLWDNNGDNVIVINGDSGAADLGDGEKRVIINGANAEIWAGYDSNTFELNAGFGNLIIENVANNTHSAEDHIIFGEGIDVEDVHFTFEYNDLFAYIDGSSDVLKVELQMYSTSKKIADFTFADETVLTWADVLDAGFEFTQTANNNTLGLNGTNFNANITSTGTNDTVYTSNGRNLVNISGSSAYLYLGSGVNTVNSSGNDSEFLANSSSNATINSSGDNDKIYAGSGANHISIAGNNSVIYGGTGHSEITLTSGFGPLAIYEQNYPSVSGNHDLVKFDNTFDKDDMWVSYNYGSWDLVLGFEGTNDVITVAGQLNGSPYKFVDFEFADSTFYDVNDILDLTFRFNLTSNNQYMDHSYTSVDELFNVSGANDTVLLGVHTNEVNVSGNNATIYSKGTDTINMDGANATIYGGAKHADVNLTSGFGNLKVYENTAPTVSGTVDTFYFDSSFDKDDMWVSYTMWSWDRIIGFEGSNDTITFYGNGPSKKFELEFSDSTVYSWSDLNVMRMRFESTTNNAYYDHNFITGDELFVISGDNATLYTGYGDTIVELSGDDADMYAYRGTSTFNVSGTNDIIYGTSNGTSATVNFNAGGNIFYSGTKKSIININADHGTFALHEDAYKSSSSDKDEVHFDDDVDASDIAFFMSGNDLLLSYNDNSDIVTIYKQNQSNYQAGKLVLDDGSYLTAADINQVITDMSSYASTNSISFTSLTDVQNSSALMNIIANAWQAA